VALAGTVMLTAGGGRVGVGDLLVLGCALAFALHIVLLGRWSAGLPAAPLAMVQMGTAAIVFNAAAVGQFRPPTGNVWYAIVITGVFASALAFFVQTWAQQHLSPSRTALI